MSKENIINDIKVVSNPCIAQVGPSSTCMTVKPMGDCCKNIVQNVDPVSIYMKEVKASILKGRVNCGNSTTGVEGVIVVATGPNGKHYVGITNNKGEYSICVPSVSSNTIYSIEAYCCGTCSGATCTDAPCECGCK